MTKDDIMKAIWNEFPDHTIHDARMMYETTIDIIKATLSKGEDIHLRAFGIFKVREKSKRIGRNPKTGQEAVIRERRLVTFTPSKLLKNKIKIGDHKNGI
ncbi:MAG: HU family DNA-binding protein [bacterium]